LGVLLAMGLNLILPKDGAEITLAELEQSREPERSKKPDETNKMVDHNV
jgi:hypothetical protein